MWTSWTTVPFAPFAAIAAARGADAVSAARLITTVEGEYAIVAETSDGAIGLVYGDDTVDVVDGDSAIDVEVAVRTRRLDLGVRPRRYLHTPPARWTWSGTPRMSIYTAPQDDARIVVWPSLPHGTIDDAWQLFGAELAAAGNHATAAFGGTSVAVDEMTGVLREVEGTGTDGEARRWGVASLEDGHAAYLCCLSARADVFDRQLLPFTWLVDSITPLPAIVATTSLGCFDAWTD